MTKEVCDECKVTISADSGDWSAEFEAGNYDMGEMDDLGAEFEKNIFKF